MKDFTTVHMFCSVNVVAVATR